MGHQPPMTGSVPSERGGYGLPAKATAAMAAAVGDDLIRDIVREMRHPPVLPSIPSATVRVVGTPEVVSGNDGPRHGGGSVSISDWRPPGDRIFNALMDQQDAIDRAERVRTAVGRLPLMAPPGGIG